MPRSLGGLRGALAEHPERGSGPQALGLPGDPTVAHLVYVDAARVGIEIATRAPDGRWWSLFLDRLDATLDLTALGIELAVREIYASTRAAGG